MIEWKPIPGFEERYEVSSDGQVASLKWGNRQPYKTQVQRSGIVTVTLYADRKRKNLTVHKVMAEAFVRPLEDGEIVRHLNGNKQDNRLDNLRIEKRRKAPPKEKAGIKRKLTIEQVREIRASYPQTPGAELARRYGVSRQLISQIVNNKMWKDIV